MARPFTTTQRNTVAASHVWHLARCEVLDVDDTWQDLATLGPDNVDVFLGATLTDNVDAQAWTASIRVRLSYGTEGASPLLAASVFNRDGTNAYAPLLNVGARVRLFAKTALPTDTLGSITEYLIFDGRVDRSDFTRDPMVLTCRDLGGKLSDTIIRVQRYYGAEDGSISDADVIQQLLTDNAGILGESITLETDGSPDFPILSQTAVNVSVYDAIQLVASLSGKVVRYRFQSDGTFKLTLYDPLREKTTPDYTVAPSEYHAVDQAAIDSLNVRNVVRVWYTDAAGVAAFVEVDDPDSVAVFGERFMQLGGEATTNITTAQQADNLANFALSDLSMPRFDWTAKSTFTWFSEIHDLIEWTGNNVHTDDPQELAVIGLTHEFPDGGQGAATTSWECRGTPAGAYERWFRLQGGPQVSAIPPAPTIDFVLGESDSYGADEDDDTSGYDGGIWVGGTMNAGCETMAVYAELADGEGFSVDQTSSTQAIPDFRRPDGIEGTDPNFRFFFRLSTRAGFYKRITIVGKSSLGRPSKENIWPVAVQAVDPVPTPEDGVIDSITVTRSPNGIDYLVSVTPASVDTVNTENWLVITRNGITVFRLMIGTSLATVNFLDTGLDFQNTYQYDAFIWNNGVSGPKNRWVDGPPTSTPTTPTFTLGPVGRLIGGVVQVYMEGTSDVPGANRMAVVKSINQIVTTTFSPMAGPPWSPFTAVDPDIAPKWYKLIAWSTSDSDVWDESPWVWWPGIGPTGSQGPNPPVFVDDTPKTELAGGTGGTVAIPVLAIRWTCATSGAVQIAIQQSDDNGASDPWTTIYTDASVASGEFRSFQLADDAAWYRLAALDAGSAIIANSAGVLYDPAF